MRVQIFNSWFTFYTIKSKPKQLLKFNKKYFLQKRIEWCRSKLHRISSLPVNLARTHLHVIISVSLNH